VRFSFEGPLLDVVPPDIDQSVNLPPLAKDSATGSDAELLRRYARNSDDAAFAAVVQRYVDLVYSAALRQLAGDRPQAEDVTQAVFTELARQAARLQTHPALSGWLHTTTCRMARTGLRAERRRQQREHASITMEPPPESLDHSHDALDWSKIAAVLDEALHELTERDRTAVVLRFFQSRPFAEIGQALGLSGNAARMRVDRALDRLRDRLARRGIDSTSAALAAAMVANAIQAAPAGLASSIVGVAIAASAGATLSTASSLITTMLSLKSKIIMGGLAATLVAVPLVLQNESLDQLRGELAESNAARQALAQSEAEARRAAELATAENLRLRASQTELLRLRGEVGPLRDQVRALTRPPIPAVSSGSPRVAPASPKAEPGPAEMADVGAATAENAANSLIWAVSKGRLDRFSELLELPAGVPPGDAQRHVEFFANQLSNVFAGMDFVGWKMDLKGTTNEDMVRLDYGYRDLESGKDDTFPFLLRRLDTGWKIVVEGEVPTDF
jgi:RNA polymerase sigma factor (sigma-70 family)